MNKKSIRHSDLPMLISLFHQWCKYSKDFCLIIVLFQPSNTHLAIHIHEPLSPGQNYNNPTDVVRKQAGLVLNPGEDMPGYLLSSSSRAI